MMEHNEGIATYELSQCDEYNQIKIIFTDDTSVTWRYSCRDGTYEIQMVDNNGNIIFPCDDSYGQCDNSNELATKGALPIYDGT